VFLELVSLYFRVFGRGENLLILQVMNWGYILTGAGLLLAFLGLVFKLVIDRKEATIQKLNTDFTSLQRQLSEAKENSPDARAGRLLKKIGILDKDIELLSQDHAKNEQALSEKVEELEKTNQELEKLKVEIERANELLEEASYYKEQFACPWCSGEVTEIFGDDEEYRSYNCGYSYGPNGNYPCPYDPEYPKIEDYALEIRKLGSDKFFCVPKAKNKNAHKLSLQPQGGSTEDEAKQKIIDNYNRLLPKRLRGLQI